MDLLDLSLYVAEIHQDSNLVTYTCQYCSLSFSQQSSLKKHVAMKHAQQTPHQPLRQAVDSAADSSGSAAGRSRKRAKKTPLLLFECTQCEDKFAGLEELTAHMEVHVCRKPYKCSLCKEAFSSPAELGEHMESHSVPKAIGKRRKTCSRVNDDNEAFQSPAVHDDQVIGHVTAAESYRCQLCSSSFRRPRDLNSHTKISHKADKPNKCSLCGRNYELPSELKLHMLCHGDKPYRCPHCDKEYFKFSNLKTHVKQFHRSDSDEEVMRQCTVCYRKFELSIDLQLHSLVHGEKPYRCPHCEKIYNKFSNLKSHVTACHRRGSDTETPCSCSVCGMRFRKTSSLELHMVFHGEKPYRCPLCDASCDDLSSFKDHVKCHVPALPIGCQICERRFATRSKWRRHQQSQHSDSARHPCALCESTFVNAALLDDHVQTLHDPSVSKPPKTRLPCPHCTSTFVVQYNLDRHIQKHYEGTRHWCSDCGRSFGTFEELQLHHERQHIRYPEQLGGVEGIVPAKPVERAAAKEWECIKCSAMFRSEKELLWHMRSHDPKLYGCSQCGLSFYDLDVLQKHVQKYVPCGWCKCTECGEEFALCDELQEHLMTSHSRTYRCRKCDKSFAMMRHLLKHEESHA